ncbi:unnamed protein product, partial [Medioppia subpectinata]
WSQTVGQQLDDLRRAFADNGFVIDLIEVHPDSDRMPRQHIIDFMPNMMNGWRNYFDTDKQFESDKKDLMEIVFDSSTNPEAERPDPKAWSHFLANESITEVVKTEQIVQICLLSCPGVSRNQGPSPVLRCRSQLYVDN